MSKLKKKKPSIVELPKGGITFSGMLDAAINAKPLPLKKIRAANSIRASKENKR